MYEEYNEDSYLLSTLTLVIISITVKAASVLFFAPFVDAVRNFVTVPILLQKRAYLQLNRNT